MQTQNLTKRRTKHFLAVFTTWVLLIALLLQSMAMTTFAALGGKFGPNGLDTEGIQNNLGGFDSDATIAQLKKDFLNSINKDLLMKIEDYELTGEVGLIISFSDNSLVSAFSNTSTGMTFEEYRSSSAATKLQEKLASNQSSVLDALLEKGLISEVKYNYYNILDGAFVTTTYEQVEAICDTEGVERVMISDRYLPLEAVENPVNVYDTGIFNSGDVTYSGKGTIVAILDTGCDYTHSAFTSYEVQSPLYDRDDIAALLGDTRAYQIELENGFALEPREVYYGNLTGNKIAFGYDYADRDPDIMPFSSEHGTHVAGIIAGKDDTITGVAIDAQLAIMKVFSDYKDGAEDGDILAALEDSVVLGVDAINMSLGTSCGFTREVDDDFKNSIYDNIEKAGISLVVAASNDYSSGYGSEFGNTNKTNNPDSATVGAPSTYEAAMSVASINGNKDKYMLANGNFEVFFHESSDMSGEEYDFFAMLGIEKGMTVEYEYVTVPGFGLAINYAGLDANGKIALVRRGDISFEEKVQYAYEAGAIAVIIYNNVFGDIIMSIGNDAKIPAVSIGKDEGDILAMKESGTLEFDLANVAGPFMSDFSSWGPNPDLTLKPEITAHGGNILSAIPGGDYDKLSGTSMAAPNMCGITVLIRQYVKEKYPELSAPEVRDLVNQLTMSTATIANDRKGNPYSPRKQGAGIADIKKATTTPAYLYVDGIGKTKLELFDDPTRSGVYTMSINLKNLSDASVSYRIGNVAMTETLSTSDKEFVAEMGYILNNSAEYSVEGGSFTNGVVTVAAGATAKITATLTLSAADKAYLNASFKNGMYVEGFLTFDNTDEAGVDLNAPFLAFYGDWSEAPIFDLDFYEVETEAHNNAIDDEDKIKADYYATTPTGTYYYDYILPLGSYVYDMSADDTPIPATEDKAAVSYYADCISGIYGVFTGLLRGAKELTIEVVDTTTGKVVWSDTDYNCYKAHASGGVPRPYVASMDLAMVDGKTGEVFGGNNTKYEVTMTAKLDWNGNRNSSDTYSFSFYIDYEAPSVTDATFRTEYDKSLEKNRYYVDIMVYDNHYAMSLRPVVIYSFVDDDGESKKTYAALTNNPVPIYQENRGEASKVTLEITDYIDIFKDSDMPEGITVYIDDYAMNSGVSYIPFPETENSELDFLTPSLDLGIGATKDLATLLGDPSGLAEVDTDYLKTLTWSTSDDTVLALKDGKIETLKTGTATVTVTGSTWFTKTSDGKKGERIYKTITVNVGEEVVDDPNSSDNVQIEKLEFSFYETLFAFNSDIDYSQIGITGTKGYFDGRYNLSFYPSEKVKLHYNLEPWNLPSDKYELKWISSNPKVATVDENGVVTAESEGRARISLQIKFGDKTSLLEARCTIEVKSEFIIENRTLVAYKGKGGDVIIPDDEGIVSIGAFAFCHYNLDNTLEVEKDEDGYYDLDLKKEPIGNNTLTSVVIPEGVETIDKYAFYNCKLLRDVTLPESCKTVAEHAFDKCEVLENVNLENVTFIKDYAFYKCDSLTCDELGGVDLSNAYAIGDYAFAESRLSEVHLNSLSRTGVGAFANCKKLETVELGTRTRLAKNMFENTAITSIVVYSDTVQDQAFKGCTALKTVELVGDLTYLGYEAFAGCTALTSLTFGGVCEEIATSAFSNCKKLTTLTLPDCDVVLGDAVFSDSGLTKLVFGANTYLETVGINSFYGIRGLSFDANASNNYKLVDNSILYNKDGTRLVLALPDAKLGAFTVPAQVVEICDGAFSANRYLTSVVFASGSKLESIGSGAFADCAALTGVLLPDNEITVEDYAFYNATSLKTVNLEKVSSVGDYAFYMTALSELTLSTDGVTIGEGAFYGCTALKNVTLGASAHIGEFAFAESGVVVVQLKGDGVTVDGGAFALCMNLASFDFDKITGKVGDLAFCYCTSLTSVNMPSVTEIGAGSFADCYNLKSFTAESLKTIGESAFSTTDEEATQGAGVVTVVTPSLEKVGDGAFYGCIYLTDIDISNVTDLGANAFAFCQSLKSLTLNEGLTELRDATFYGCTALGSINLDKVVRFGWASLYGVKLPAQLNLESAEHIGSQAFVEQDGVNYIEFVNAPNLTYVADQAFAGCLKLTGIYAPKLEYVDYGAFAYTSIEEFEVAPTLGEISFGVFEGCTDFAAFYITVDGEKLYDFENENVMLKDGVLYTVNDKGYILACYPPAKTDKEFTVADGTTSIAFGAAMDSTSLEKVVLPESLRNIGNFAFYGCTNLKTVVFKSYYAPTLEGTATGAQIEITPDTIGNYPRFDKLYRYEYYFRSDNVVAMPLYYSTFVDVVTSAAASNLTYVIPDSCEGYDSVLYKAYFDASEETSGPTVGKYAVAFIDAAKALPETADRFDKKLIDAAINAYNALEGHSEEMKYVDEALIAHFEKVRSEYNVSVAENKIAHLFDMDASEYSYELVKDARATFLALTEAEKGMVSNAAVLEAKIEELSEKMGQELDFSLSFKDYIKEEPPVTPPSEQPDGGLDAWVVVLIVCASVAVCAAAAFGIFVFIKKKRAMQ